MNENKYEVLCNSDSIAHLKSFIESRGKEISYEELYNLLDDDFKSLCDRYIGLYEEIEKSHFTEFTKSITDKIDFSENNGLYGQMSMLAVIAIIDMAYKEGGKNVEDCNRLNEIEKESQALEVELDKASYNFYKSKYTD